MAAISENAKKLLTFFQENNDEVTVHDVSEATGLAVNSITGTFNSFVKKGWGERVPAEVELEDGSHKAVKLLKLTEVGMAIDPDAKEEA